MYMHMHIYAVSYQLLQLSLALLVTALPLVLSFHSELHKIYSIYKYIHTNALI